MADFSAGEAITSGFRLIGRNPAAILWWAGVRILVGFLPPALALWAVAPDLIGFYQQMLRQAAEHAHVSPDMSAFLGLQSRLAILQPITLISLLVNASLVMGAIYRGVLYPQERRFGYLRFSMREVWLGLVIAVLYVAFVILCVVAAIVAGVSVVAAATSVQHGGGGAGGIVAGVIILAAAAAVIWLIARFCLALPLSFDARTFAIGESWELTAGHALKIILTGLAVFVILLLVELVFAGLLLGVIVGAVTHGAGLTSFLHMNPADMVRRVLPWVPLWIIAGSLVGAAFYAILAAPLADIYRQLTRSERV